MALTQERQAELEVQEAMEASRRAHELAMDKRRTRLETIRLSKETLIENARNKPLDERGVTAESITAFAAALEAYIGE